MNNKKPNKKTLEAIKEIEEFENNPSKGNTYVSVDELMKDLLDKND